MKTSAKASLWKPLRCIKTHHPCCTGSHRVRRNPEVQLNTHSSMPISPARALALNARNTKSSLNLIKSNLITAKKTILSSWRIARPITSWLHCEHRRLHVSLKDLQSRSAGHERKFACLSQSNQQHPTKSTMVLKQNVVLASLQCRFQVQIFFQHRPRRHIATLHAELVVVVELPPSALQRPPNTPSRSSWFGRLPELIHHGRKNYLMWTHVNPFHNTIDVEPWEMAQAGNKLSIAA